MELLAATSSAVERGGSVREAGTEKIMWRSIVHSEGMNKDTQTDTCTVTKRLHEQKVRNLRRQLITRPKLLPAFSHSVSLSA